MNNPPLRPLLVVAFTIVAVLLGLCALILGLIGTPEERGITIVLLGASLILWLISVVIERKGKK